MNQSTHQNQPSPQGLKALILLAAALFLGTAACGGETGGTSSGIQLEMIALPGGVQPTDAVRDSDGSRIAFSSESSDLVPGDTNGKSDVFVVNVDGESIARVSVNSNGEQGNGFSFHPAISADGRYVAFASNSSNLVGGDSNGASDIFIHDHATGKTARASVWIDDSQLEGDSFSPRFSEDGSAVEFDHFVSAEDTEPVSLIVPNPLAP
ncbi:MAG: hypothetical protein AB1405_09730 [Bdellovibrionota bacterium]